MAGGLESKISLSHSSAGALGAGIAGYVIAGLTGAGVAALGVYAATTRYNILNG